MRYPELDILFTESECIAMENDHMMQSYIDAFHVEATELYMEAASHIISDHETSILYENACSDLISKLSGFIQKVIDNVSLFFRNLKIKIFGSKEEKEKLAQIKEAVKSAKKLPESARKQIKVYRTKKNKKALDAYIKEMAQLERRLMRLKVEANNDPGDGLSMLPVVGGFVVDRDNTASIMVEYNDIKEAMDKCNSKYEKLIEQNAEVVELALADAIRFSDKDLKDIELDMDAIKADSDKVLAKFKEDAKGVKVKEQANLLQRMTSSIETHVRKYMRDSAGYHQKNTTALLAISKIVGITFTSLGASEALKAMTLGKVDIAGSVANAAVNTYQNKVVPALQQKAGPTVDKAINKIPPLRDNRLNRTGIGTFAQLVDEDNPDKKTPEVAMRIGIAQEVYAWSFAGFAPKAKISNDVKNLIQATYANSDKLTYVYELPYLVSIDFSDTVIAKNSPKKMNMVQNMQKYVNKHQEFSWPKQFVDDLSKAKEDDTEDYFSRFMTLYLKEVIKIQDVSGFKATIRSYRNAWKTAQTSENQ